MFSTVCSTDALFIGTFIKIRNNGGIGISMGYIKFGGTLSQKGRVSAFFCEKKYLYIAAIFFERLFGYHCYLLLS